MSRSKLPVIILITGFALIVLSLVLTWITMQALQQGMGIIGGADAPTVQYLLFYRHGWLAYLGIATSLAGAVWLLVRKKHK